MPKAKKKSDEEVLKWAGDVLNMGERMRIIEKRKHHNARDKLFLKQTHAFFRKGAPGIVKLMLELEPWRKAALYKLMKKYKRFSSENDLQHYWDQVLDDFSKARP